MPATRPGSYCHQPVLTQQVLAGFAAMPQPEHWLDCTIGGAGHSSLLLAAHPHGRLTGLDQDPVACRAAAMALAPFEGRWHINHCNFAHYEPPAPQGFSGLLADLGVSSPQLEQAERGFSLRHAGPVDMRMNPGTGETAAQLLQRLSQVELAALIRTHGEDRRARAIARRLVARRPFASTTDLAAAVAGAYPPRQRYGPHPPGHPHLSGAAHGGQPGTGSPCHPPAAGAGLAAARGRLRCHQLSLPGRPHGETGLPQ